MLATKDKATGISVHALPKEKVSDELATRDNFNRINALLNTLEVDEAIGVESKQILTRLFHDESCRLFEAYPVEFGCICSADKSLKAIKSLGQDDVQNLINEQVEQGNDNLVVDCHFCFQRYEFSFEHINRLLA